MKVFDLYVHFFENTEHETSRWTGFIGGVGIEGVGVGYGRGRVWNQGRGGGGR